MGIQVNFTFERREINILISKIHLIFFLINVLVVYMVKLFFYTVGYEKIVSSGIFIKAVWQGKI